MVEFSPEVTIITGANGSGKTSLLEAIYVSLQGSSFKGSDTDLLKKEAPWWRIDISFDDTDNRVVKFYPEKVSSRKQFIIDNKTTARIPAKLKYPVVLFEPEDLRLLHGSPARRRQFIDRFIGQLNPLYGPSLRKYERALKQRNNLLKNLTVSDDELFAWNISLADHGAFIIEQRIAFIEQINQNLGRLYQEIAGTHDDVTIHYSHTFVGDVKQKLLNELQAHLPRDRYLGSTSVGPHRHDVIFQINNSPALSVASRGEARTIVLALKFLEVDIIEQLIDKQPIILLDDVFSELDASRQQLLTSQLNGHQIIITSATSHAGDHLYHVKL
jgi:DNA replication and repair protein RecF